MLTTDQQTTLDVQRTKLRHAFSSLRIRGFIARQNFECCSSCAIAALLPIAESDTQGIVFYTQQDHDHMLRTGNVFLTFGAKNAPYAFVTDMGHHLVEVFRAYGLNATWSGINNDAINIDLLTDVPSDLCPGCSEERCESWNERQTACR